VASKLEFWKTRNSGELTLGKWIRFSLGAKGRCGATVFLFLIAWSTGKLGGGWLRRCSFGGGESCSREGRTREMLRESELMRVRAR
jgi:hypothetical protein